MAKAHPAIRKKFFNELKCKILVPPKPFHIEKVQEAEHQIVRLKVQPVIQAILEQPPDEIKSKFDIRGTEKNPAESTSQKV